jgi:hypothetical protein
MARKNPFPPEPETKPDAQSVRPRKRAESAPAPKSRRERSEAPTLPPPRNAPAPPSVRPPVPPGDRASDVRSVKKKRIVAATVDEVTADLSKDPRRERDDDGDGADTETPRPKGAPDKRR